jgi:hypothetical protein
MTFTEGFDSYGDKPDTKGHGLVPLGSAASREEGLRNFKRLMDTLQPGDIMTIEVGFFEENRVEIKAMLPEYSMEWEYDIAKRVFRVRRNT